MGCGSSVNLLDNVAPPKQTDGSAYLHPTTFVEIPETTPAQSNLAISALEIPIPSPKKEQERVRTASTAEEMKHQAMKHVPEGKGYIFGQSQSQRKIILMDCQKMQFSILSSRMQMPSTPNKYQPKDIIFEQSQQMLASNLFNKNSHPPYNFMYITFINDETIFLCGGVNYSFQYFSEEAFFFRVSSISQEQSNVKRKKIGNNLVGNKFEKLPCMKQKRYSHMGAFFKTGRLGYIYIFGGRDEEDQLLSSCQQYSIQQKKWRDITPMKSPRSTGFSLIFKNKIYIFGGYTSEKKRSKVIEVYDPAKNYWENLNVKIHRGIQAGLIFSLKSNQILLMGGNMESGSLKSAIKINLADQTYLWDSNMKSDRLLQKGIKYNDTIFVFGGDFQDNFQKYNCKDRKWKDLQFSYNEFVSIDDINSYQMATQTLQVTFDETLLAKNQNAANDFDRYHIFGNDNFPCILELNLNKWVLKKKAVPMVMRLRCHMGVTKIVEGKYFLCGGIDSMEEKASKAAYIYYAGTNKAIQVAKMSCKKYNFSICANNKYVYIFGGKNHEGQILNQCQKYSFQEDKWTKLPNLPVQRTNAKALMIGTKIFLFGGNDTLQNISTIDIFNTQDDNFWNSKQSLSMSSEIKSVFLDQRQKTSTNVFIFSHNEVLSKHYCHYLRLNIPTFNQEGNQQEKIEQNFSVVKQIEQKQMSLKILPFSHSFAFAQKISIITQKGIFAWNPSEQQAKGFQSQIVINQVEMLQFPTQKFSSSF